MISAKIIKELQKNGKARRTQGLFVAEGTRVVSEVPKDYLEMLCVSQSYEEAHAVSLEEAGVPVQVLSDSRFRALSDTKSPQGILAVVRQKPWSEDDLFRDPAPLLLVLENLQDPGNAGTILRTAEAAGCAGIILTEGTVDLYSPKTARSTMGAIFRLPHITVRDIAEASKILKKHGVRSFAASLKESADCYGCDYRGGTAFFIGNEGSGLTDEAEKLADTRIRIPMAGQTESLNAAMAAGILLYEAVRQRR